MSHLLRWCAVTALVVTQTCLPTVQAAGWIEQRLPGGLAHVMDGLGKTVYVGSHRRLYKSIDAGVRWTLIEEFSDLVTSLEVVPNNPNRVYVGLSDGRLYRSFDGGLTWTGTNLDQSVADNAVVGIQVAAADTTRVYAAVRDVGVFASTDRGGTWALTTKQPGRKGFTAFAAAPSDPGTLYAAVPGYGVYRTRNGGEVWTRLTNGLALDQSYFGMAVHPTSRDIVYVGSAWRVYRTGDGGANWVNTQNGLPAHTVEVRALAMDPAHPGGVLVTFGSAHYGVATRPVYRSDDEGANWSALGALDAATPPNAYGIVRTSDGRLVLATGRGAFVSNDHGASWEESNRGFEEGHAADLAIDPLLADNLYVVGRTGAFRSYDGGQIWRSRTNGILDQSLSAVVASPTTPGRVYTVDNRGNFYLSNNRAGSWADSALPDRPFSASSIRHLIASTGVAGRLFGLDETTGNFYQFDDHGTTIDEVATGLPGGQGARTVTVISPANPNILYLAQHNQGLFRSSDGGATWQQMASVGLPEAPSTVLAVDPLNIKILFAGVFGHGLYKSTDSGATWARLTGQQTDHHCTYPRSIAIDPVRRTNILAWCDYDGFIGSIDGGARFIQMLPMAAMYDPQDSGTNESRIVYDPFKPERTWAVAMSRAYRHDGAIAVDLELDPSAPTTTTVGSVFKVKFVLRNQRGGTATGLGVDMAFTGPGRIEVVNLPGGVCTVINSRSARCERDTLAVGTPVTGYMTIEARNVGTVRATFSASSREHDWDGAPAGREASTTIQ